MHILQKFVEEVHAHGMKIILDGVFNHCGSFHKWLDREKLYEQSRADTHRELTSAGKVRIVTFCIPESGSMAG